MERTSYLAMVFLVASITLSGCLFFEEAEIEEEWLSLKEFYDGFNSPWSLEFVPETDLVLVTEKEGDLSIFNKSDASVGYVEGVPEVYDGGQGGLLDVETHPDFSENGFIYLTFSGENNEGAATHLGRGVLDLENFVLEDFEVLHVAEPFVRGGSHFGSRITFDEDNNVYFTVGDRGEKDFGPDHVSQNLSNELGTTIRLEEDGSIPDDNPFVENSSLKDSIYSYGHRNSQGMTTHPEKGEIWQSEHGEEDGDEINVLEKGGNYGWPITHYGCHYGTNDPVGDYPHENPGVVNPVYYWECNSGGFPPAGITFYTGDYSEWNGDLFVSGLASNYLARFSIEEEGDNLVLTEEEGLLKEQGWRVRDVEEHSDSLYVVTDGGRFVKISPNNTS